MDWDSFYIGSYKLKRVACAQRPENPGMMAEIKDEIFIESPTGEAGFFDESALEDAVAAFFGEHF